jgi:hypothetical protein
MPAKKVAKKATKKVAKKAAKTAVKKVAKKAPKTAVKTTAAAPAPVAAPTLEEIEVAAFYIYLRRCEQGLPGTPDDDWAAAVAQFVA